MTGIWIEGDIGGLRSIGVSWQRVAPDAQESGEVISKRVDRLVGDAGWNGDAAEVFRGGWEQDAAAVVQLAGCLQMAGACLQQLADTLWQAQLDVDRAVQVAAAAGVRFSMGPMPEPLPGVYSGVTLQAAQQLQVDARAAQEKAQQAREIAAETLHDIAWAMTGQGDPSFLLVQDTAGLTGVLKGYYTVPEKLNVKALATLDRFLTEYKATQFARKHSPAKSTARKELAQKLKGMRLKNERLRTRLDSAEKLADHFKAGKLLNTSVGDLMHGGGILEEGSKVSRVLGGVPVVDVILGGLATAVQVRDDTQRGWSWQHALAVDGGSNVAAIAVGVATDFIPFAGPFLSPVTGYGAAAAVYEAGHEGHWTDHISKDGWVLGLGEGVGDTAKAEWNNDVIGVGGKIIESVEHPQQAAEELWRGITSW